MVRGACGDAGVGAVSHCGRILRNTVAEEGGIAGVCKSGRTDALNLSGRSNEALAACDEPGALQFSLMRSTLILGKSRIEALSDGVFSITMTLLVLKLEVPEVMHHSSNQQMLQQLLALGPQFATYVVTFLVAGAFWFLHHLTFHFIGQMNGVLVWVNLIFLMFVALLPFSAGLMGHLLIHPVSQLFYFGNQLAIAAVLNAHWLYAKHKGLVETIDPTRASRLTVRIGVTAAVFAACMITSLFLPEWSWVPLPIFLAGGVIVESRK